MALGDQAGVVLGAEALFVLGRRVPGGRLGVRSDGDVRQGRPEVFVGDDVLLEIEGVTVTRAKATLNGVTYPLSGITSVRTLRTAPSTGGALLLGLGSLAGALVFGMAAAGAAKKIADGVDLSTPVSFGALAVTCGVLGVLLLNSVRAARPSFAVVLGTAGGDKRAFHTKDEQLAAEVRAAIEQAITERG